MTMLETQLARIKKYHEEFLLVLGESKSRLPIILGLMLLAATLDLIGVGLVAPLVGVISSGQAHGITPAFANHPRLVFLLLGMTVVSVYVIKGFIAYAVNRRIVAFGELHRASLIRRLMRAFQTRDWSYHLRHGTTEIVNKILWHTNTYTNGTLIPALRLTADLLVFLFLTVLLALQDFSAVVMLILMFGVAFLFIYRRLRFRMQATQSASGTANAQLISGVTQAIGGFREIRVLGSEDYFLQEVAHAAKIMGEANANWSALGQAPRYVMEALMVVFIVILAAIRFALEGSAAAVIPIVGTFAVAGIRLLPAVTSIISSVNNMRSSRFALRELAQEISALSDFVPIDTVSQRPVHEDSRYETAFQAFCGLVLKGVWVSYERESPPALMDVNLVIRKGESVGVMGESGAGKSTLADTILGFLAPQLGSVEVNGCDIQRNLRSWLAIAAYIPQAAYILDDTIRRNIMFGEPTESQDEEKLRCAVSLARLEDVVARLPSGLDTTLGERGIRLSGGQRQRVALARALYHDRDFIILDEATAALDAQTEREVVEAIKSLHGVKTLFIIAHRESTLAGCDRIIRLQGGRIVDHIVRPGVDPQRHFDANTASIIKI